MFEMSEEEANRFIEATQRINYTVSTAPSGFFKKALCIFSAKEEHAARYIFNLGQIIERIEHATGDGCEYLPRIDEAPIIEALQECTGQVPQRMTDHLYGCLVRIQEEAFRYGYYVALENETIVL